MTDNVSSGGTTAKKVAVVTGAARGIGLSVSQNLEKCGYYVVYADISFDGDKEMPKTAVICDIANPESRKNLLNETLKKFGRIDMLVNNAGVAPKVRMDILETTEESFRRLININLEGTFFMCQLFANAMIGNKTDTNSNNTDINSNNTDINSACGKRIINIASISSYTSSVIRGEYCISKAGVSMVTQLFADRLAEYGIGVFEIRPGIIMTDMTAGVKDKYEKLIRDGLTPTPRFGQPQDVADAAIAIASGYFDFSTGQVFNVDGGFHIRRL